MNKKDQSPSEIVGKALIEAWELGQLFRQQAVDKVNFTRQEYYETKEDFKSLVKVTLKQLSEVPTSSGTGVDSMN